MSEKNKKDSANSQKASKRRLQVTMSERGFNDLDEVVDMVDAVSEAEGVRASIKISKAVLKEITAGRTTIICQNPNNPSDHVTLKLTV